MTIYIAHAAADAEVAQALEKFVERRGKFVELDDGETALAPVGPRDVVVVLISQNLVMSPWRLRLEQRALDAWADGRLVLVKLDRAFPPVGLRDLPSIDASFDAQREFKWGEVAAEIDKKLNAPAHELPSARDAAEDGAGATPRVTKQNKPLPKRRRGGSPPLVFLGLLLILIGGAVLYLAAIMAGLTSAPLPSIEAALSLAADVAPSAVAATGGAMLLVGLIAFFAGQGKRRRVQAEESAEDDEAPPRPRSSGAPGGVFVSYARVNAPVVLPMIDAAKRAGRKFWLDQHGLKAGQGWAGEIVRAIRGAPGVLVMCSKAAFESDQVKREVYLADRYKKRLMPVFVEDAVIPDDFEFFFAGVQELHLQDTPEAERPAALLAALEAA